MVVPVFMRVLVPVFMPVVMPVIMVMLVVMLVLVIVRMPVIVVMVMMVFVVMPVIVVVVRLLETVHGDGDVRAGDAELLRRLRAKRTPGRPRRFMRSTKAWGSGSSSLRAAISMSPAAPMAHSR